MNQLQGHVQLVVQQRKELVELLGFETRNKYEINSADGTAVLYCAEQQKGMLGILARQFLGHWRSFELIFFDINRQPVWKAVHPFRWFFQRLDLFEPSGRPMGSVEWRWGFLRKRFSLIDLRTGRVFEICSGFFSFWTFTITHNGIEVGKVQKKWSGLLKEVFTDTDNFLVEFSPTMTDGEKALLLSTAVLIDLQYFENKGRGGLLDAVGD